MTMKLAVAWFGSRQQTASNYFEMARSLGLEFVEVPLYWHLIEDPRFDLRSAAGIEGVQRAATAAGVRLVSGVADIPVAGVLLDGGRSIDRSMCDFAAATAKRAIDVAAALGLEVIRLTESEIPAGPGAEARRYMEDAGRALLELGDYAAEREVRIVAENYVATSEQMAWLLDVADHPAVGTLFDPCNYFRNGEDPLAALRRVSGRIHYCQVKDALAGDRRSAELFFQGSRWPPSEAVGEGEIEWAPVLSELAKTYDGYLAIEYERPDDVSRGVRVSIETLRSIAGPDTFVLAG